jgi:hypothetical protein
MIECSYLSPRTVPTPRVRFPDPFPEARMKGLPKGLKYYLFDSRSGKFFFPILKIMHEIIVKMAANLL